MNEAQCKKLLKDLLKTCKAETEMTDEAFKQIFEKLDDNNDA